LSGDQSQFSGDSVYMQVARANELSRLDIFPQAKIDTAAIFPHHPSQEHVDALTSRFPCRSSNMLSCTFGIILQRKKQIVEVYQPFFHIIVRCKECIFQSSVLLKICLKKL